MSRKYNTLLWDILKQQMTEEEIYASYFHDDHLSSSEFSALISNLTPDRYHEIIHSLTPASDEEYAKCSEANTKIRLPLLKSLNKQTKVPRIITEEDLILPFSYLIEWVARNKILLPKQFMKYLSDSLKHIHIQFHPRRIALREDSKYSSSYHKARFQEVVDECFEELPEITPTQILQLNRITSLLKSFNYSYRKRTLKEWIAEDHPFPQGRPKKRSKNG